MGSLIDTSIFVAVERGDAGVRAALERIDLASEDYAVAAITVSELIHGVAGRTPKPGAWRAKRPSRRSSRRWP